MASCAVAVLYAHAMRTATIPNGTLNT
jgi:hypothetical protein